MDWNILIVEDEAKLREVLCDFLRSKGEIPAEAADGVQALGLLEERDFDAVLLDIMMPNLDGLSVCRAVRKTNDVPIILLTAPVRRSAGPRVGRLLPGRRGPQRSRHRPGAGHRPSNHRPPRRRLHRPQHRNRRGLRVFPVVGTEILR